MAQIWPIYLYKQKEDYETKNNDKKKKEYETREKKKVWPFTEKVCCPLINLLLKLSTEYLISLISIWFIFKLTIICFNSCFWVILLVHFCMSLIIFFIIITHPNILISKDFWIWLYCLLFLLTLTLGVCLFFFKALLLFCCEPIIISTLSEASLLELDWRCFPSVEDIVCFCRHLGALPT